MKDIEGNTNEMSIDLKNFSEELEEMDEYRTVQHPGERIKRHLEVWDRDLPKTTEDEIREFGVSLPSVTCLAG